MSVVDALEAACHKDVAACIWIIELDKHYQKLELTQ